MGLPREPWIATAGWPTITARATRDGRSSANHSENSPPSEFPHERHLVDVEAVDHAGDDIDRLLPKWSTLPVVGRRQAMTGEIDEQMAVSGQPARERRHPDPWRRDAVDEHDRIAGPRLEDTHPHGRRRDIDPTLPYVESIRRRNTPLGHPQPGLDTPDRCRCFHDCSALRGRTRGMRPARRRSERFVGVPMTGRCRDEWLMWFNRAWPATSGREFEGRRPSTRQR